MPRIGGTKDSDNRELTRALTGEGSSTTQLMLTNDQRLHLTPQSPIRAVMPPLASSIWRKLDYLREKGNHLLGWTKDYASAGLTPPQYIRPRVSLFPTLVRPATFTPVWQRLLQLNWLHRRRQRKSQPLQRVPVADKEQLTNNTGEDMEADDFLLDTPLQIKDIPEEAQPFALRDELFPRVIRNLFPPSLSPSTTPTSPGNVASRYTTRANFPSIPNVPVNLIPRQVAGESGGLDTEEQPVLHISPSEIAGIYPTEPIQQPGHSHITDSTGNEGTVVQASRQTVPVYRHQWTSKVIQLPAQGMGLYRAPVKGLPRITHQSIGPAYDTPVQSLPNLPITGTSAQPWSKTVPPLTLSYFTRITGTLPPDKGTIQAVGEYPYPSLSTEKSQLPYPAPGKIEPGRPGVVFKRLSESSIPTIQGSFEKLRSRMSTKEPVSGFLASRTRLGQVPDISQASRPVSQADQLPSVTQVSRLPETSKQVAEVSRRPEEPGHIKYAQTMATEAKLKYTVPIRGLQTSPEMSIIHRQLRSVTSLPRQPSPVTGTIYPMPALSHQPYPEPSFHIPSTDASENTSFLQKKDVPSFQQPKLAHRSYLELPPTSTVEPRLGTSVIQPKESSPGAFRGVTRNSIQTTPELALAPVTRSAETASLEPLEPYTRHEKETVEPATPDIEAIARDVYNILKRRLSREKERVLGVV